MNKNKEKKYTFDDKDWLVEVSNQEHNKVKITDTWWFAILGILTILLIGYAIRGFRIIIK